MSGGPKYEYRWQDNVKYKKPTILSAPDYVNELMNWIEQLINDEAIFPTKVGEYTDIVCSYKAFERFYLTGKPLKVVRLSILFINLVNLTELRFKPKAIFKKIETCISFSGMLINT